MDEKQAARLGAYLRSARRANGLSAAHLGRLTNMPASSITRIEDGAFRKPRAETLAKIAAALDLEVADVFALAGYSTPGLPAMTPYLRAKYSELPDEAVEAIEAYASEIARKHGVALEGPAPGEDESP